MFSAMVIIAWVTTGFGITPVPMSCTYKTKFMLCGFLFLLFTSIMMSFRAQIPQMYALLKEFRYPGGRRPGRLLRQAGGAAAPAAGALGLETAQQVRYAVQHGPENYVYQYYWTKL